MEDRVRIDVLAGDLIEIAGTDGRRQIGVFSIDEDGVASLRVQCGDGETISVNGQQVGSDGRKIH